MLYHRLVRRRNRIYAAQLDNMCWISLRLQLDNMCHPPICKALKGCSTEPHFGQSAAFVCGRSVVLVI
jgi:hypothetical protein